MTPFFGDSSSLTPTHLDNRLASRILKAHQGVRGVLADLSHTLERATHLCAAITRKASGSGIQLREACRKRDKGRQSGHPGQ